MEAADVFMDVPAEDNACDTDSVPILPAQNSVQETDEMTQDTEAHTLPLTDSVPALAGCYRFRPRWVPRVTSGWADRRWTNPYHTDRIDLK